MIRVLRAFGLILSVGIASMLASMVMTDLVGAPFSTSLGVAKTKKTEFTYLSYLKSYLHRIRVGVSSPGVKLHVSIIPIGDFLKMVTNQTWYPLESTTIDGAGLFEFKLQKRGYYVILVELEGDFESTDYGLSYSFTRSIQDDLIKDGVPLIALGVILLAFSFILPRRR